MNRRLPETAITAAERALLEARATGRAPVGPDGIYAGGLGHNELAGKRGGADYYHLSTTEYGVLRGNQPFTAGGILYADGDGKLKADASNLFWEDTDKQLLLQSGSAALPPRSWIGDPDTGRYRVGANNMRDVCGGVTRIDYGTDTLGLLVTANANYSVYLFGRVNPDGNPEYGFYDWVYGDWRGGSKAGETAAAYFSYTLRFDDGDVHTAFPRTVRIDGLSFHGTDFTGTVPNTAALYIRPSWGPGGGTVTNNYGIYVEAPAGGAAINRAIHTAGGDHYLGGHALINGSLTLNQQSLYLFTQFDTNWRIYKDGAHNINFVGGGAGARAFRFYSAAALKLSVVMATGQVLHSDGSAALPVMSFITDPDLGPFRAGANIYGISAGGNHQFSVEPDRLWIDQADPGGLADGDLWRATTRRALGWQVGGEHGYGDRLVHSQVANTTGVGAVEVVMSTHPILAASWANDKVYHWAASGHAAAGVGQTIDIRVRIGGLAGTIVLDFRAASGGGADWRAEGEIVCRIRGNPGTIAWGSVGNRDGSASWVGDGTAAPNTFAAQDLVITHQGSAPGITTTVHTFNVWEA